MLLKALGRLTPKMFIGKLLLKRELKRRGIDVGLLPDELLSEITTQCLSHARGTVKIRGRGVYERFIVQIKAAAVELC